MITVFRRLRRTLSMRDAVQSLMTRALRLRRAPPAITALPPPDIAAKPAAGDAAPPRKRLWALVQTRPSAMVLLVSDIREDLEAEARELNDTWNHRELRTERHTYEIQPVAMLQTGKDPAMRDQAGRHPVGQ